MLAHRRLLVILMVTAIALMLSPTAYAQSPVERGWCSTGDCMPPSGDSTLMSTTGPLLSVESAAASEVWVCPSGDCGHPGASYNTIQAGIDAVDAGGTVNVFPGSYNEVASNRYLFNGSGPYQFGLFIGQNKAGITVRGVDASGNPITAYASVAAEVTTNATNSFGYSGIFVEADNVTIAGLRILPNTAGDNKTIEIIGDNFTLRDCHLDINTTDGGSVYFNDWRFNTGTNTSHVQRYTVEENWLEKVSVDIASGAGYSGPVSGRVIRNNLITDNGPWASISFNGSGTGVPWFVYSVGGAVIEGNQFLRGDQHIRARGDYDNSQFDWASYFNNNTFDRAVVVGPNPPGDLRTYSYVSSGYTMNNVRRIGALIQGEVDHAQAGDKVLVAAGTYVEQVIVNQSLTLQGAGASLTHIVAPAAASRAQFTIAESTATFDPVVFAYGGTRAGNAVSGAGVINFAMSDFHVNGNDDAQATPRYVGVLLRNVKPGTVASNTIDGLAPASGNPQTGGIMVYGDSNATVLGNTISSHRRIGIVVTGDWGPLPDPTANIVDNTVTGLGPTGPGSWAENGIQLSYGAAGAIRNNIVSNHSFAGNTAWAASSILVYQAAGTVEVSGNQVTNGQAGIYWVEASGTIKDNQVVVSDPFAVCAPCAGEIDGIIVDPGIGNALIPASPFADDEADKSHDQVMAAPMATAATYNVQVNNNTLTGVASAGSSDTVGLWAIAVSGDTLDFSGAGNTISKWDTGAVFYTDATSTLNVHDFKCNNIYDNNNYGAYDLTTSTADVNVELNWWGAASGPFHSTDNATGTGNAISDGFDFAPWLGAVAPGGCYASATGNFQNITQNTFHATLQDAFDEAAYGDTVVPLLPGPIPGSATVRTNGVTLNLSGRTFTGGSPALIIDADDVTILGPGVLDGWTGSANSSDPAVLVKAGADNFTIDNVEIKRWADGIQIAGAVTSLKVVSNWIHDNTDAGLQVDGAVGGVVTIEGNLFKANGGPGVAYGGSGALDAEYNSWGDLGGPNAGNGDGADSAKVDFDPWTFAEVFVDVNPDTEATQRTVTEVQTFDVKLKVDAAKLYGLAFKLTYDPNVLTLNNLTFAAPWAGRCQALGTLPAGMLAYRCDLQLPTAEYDADGGTIATLTFTPISANLSGNGPWTTLFNLAHLEADTSTSAVGGVKVFVNNAGYGAPSTAARDITDNNDGQIDIVGIARFTGFVDLQGRTNDSGATVQVFGGATIAGATTLAQGTSAASGAYTTNYISPYLLTIGNTYWFQVDAPLYLPTTARATSPSYPTLPTDWQHSKPLSMRPTTALGNVILLGGDATNDNVIDISDAACIGNRYMQSAAPCGSDPGSNADVNGDGTVTMRDLTLMGGNYYRTASPWTP